MTILDKLARHAAERVMKDQETICLDAVRQMASESPPADGKGFVAAISRPETGFICEVKKASPSKGLIDPQFDYMQIAKDYEAAGADAISCLTEPKWFLGSDAIFQEIRKEVHIPMLRKDFIVDEYQLYQSKVMGADCILLICALLKTDTIRKYLEICDALGLAALVETHDETEILTAVDAGARIIGVNNRNLKDFSVDIGNAMRLRELIPTDRVYVAESGVLTPEDATELRKAGADAILVGEAMMRAGDKAAFLKAMREAAG